MRSLGEVFPHRTHVSRSPGGHGDKNSHVGLRRRKHCAPMFGMMHAHWGASLHSTLLLSILQRVTSDAIVALLVICRQRHGVEDLLRDFLEP